MLLLKSVHAEFRDHPELGAEIRKFERALTKAAAGANVKLLDAVLPRNEVTGLMSLCDCYVSLHRAEGFGLSMAEAMALGKPVIATGYSGNLEFMTTDNSLLVDYNLVPIGRTWGPYREGQLWAEPSLEHAAQLMRRVFEDRASAMAMAERGRGAVLERLNPGRIGAMMKQRLEQVLEGG